MNYIDTIPEKGWFAIFRLYRRLNSGSKTRGDRARLSCGSEPIRLLPKEPIDDNSYSRHFLLDLIGRVRRFALRIAATTKPPSRSEANPIVAIDVDGGVGELIFASKRIARE